MASTAAADASPSSSFDVGRWLKTHPAFGFPPAAYSQPTHLGLGWTTAGSHHKHGDASGLQPIRLPNQLPLDLNEWEGERYIPKPNIHSGVEIVIAEAIAAGASPHECDIITFRNNLNKILGTPCNIKSGWAVNAVCLNSTLFLDIVKQENEWESSPEAAKFDFWGRAFEAACTGQHVADASKEWGMLVSARLNGLRVLMGAEVDCYDDSECPPGKKPPMSSLRELKTYREPQHVGHWKSIHRHKHPKWWLQSFLAGVPALVLGARDDQGHILNIHTVKTTELPRLSWNNNENWDPDQMLTFGAECLKWMRNMAQQHAGQQLRFEFKPDQLQVQCTIEAGGALGARIATCIESDPSQLAGATAAGQSG